MHVSKAAALFFASLAGAVLSAADSCAAPHLGDYSLGLSKDELIERGAEQCVHGSNAMLCNAIRFGNMEWDGRFDMAEDKLAGVHLTGPLGKKYLDAGLAGFADSEFRLVYISAGSSDFDFLSAMAEEGEDKAITDMGAFLTRLAEEGRETVSYIYVDRESYGKLAEKKQKHFLEEDIKGEVPAVLCINKKGIHIMVTTMDSVRSHLKDEELLAAREKAKFEAFAEQHPDKVEEASRSAQERLEAAEDHGGGAGAGKPSGDGSILLLPISGEISAVPPAGDALDGARKDAAAGIPLTGGKASPAGDKDTPADKDAGGKARSAAKDPSGGNAAGEDDAGASGAAGDTAGANDAGKTLPAQAAGSKDSAEKNADPAQEEAGASAAKETGSAQDGKSGGTAW